MNGHAGLYYTNFEKGGIIMIESNSQDAPFMNMQGDGFAIYQLKHSDEVTNIRFMDMEYLSRKGITVQRSYYDQVYAAPMDFE